MTTPYRYIDITEACREIASDLRDFHFTQISIRQNEIMKVRTMVATIFMPLGFVAGLSGINFDPNVSPYNMPELKWIWGYPMARGIMAAIAVGMLVFFWKRGWLPR
jgi:magnesium transporter